MHENRLSSIICLRNDQHLIQGSIKHITYSVRIAPEGPKTHPCPSSAKSSRDPVAPRQALGSPRAARLRAQLELQMSVAPRIVLVRDVEVVHCRPQGSQNVQLYKAHEKGQ